jgi:hypothetical protein
MVAIVFSHGTVDSPAITAITPNVYKTADPSIHPSIHPSIIMIDPMANLDAVPAADAAADEKDIIDVPTLRYNMQAIDKVRSVMGIASGCVAGICGLTGYEGLGE